MVMNHNCDVSSIKGMDTKTDKEKWQIETKKCCCFLWTISSSMLPHGPSMSLVVSL